MRSKLKLNKTYPKYVLPFAIFTIFYFHVLHFLLFMPNNLRDFLISMRNPLGLECLIVNLDKNFSLQVETRILFRAMIKIAFTHIMIVVLFILIYYFNAHAKYIFAFIINTHTSHVMI